MITFKEIGVEDKAVVDAYIAAENAMIAEQGFGNMFIWKDSIFSEIAIVDGFLVNKMYRGKETCYLPPFGSGSLEPVFEKLAEYSASQGAPFRMICAGTDKIREYEEKMPGRFMFIHHRDYDDYVYNAHDLSALEGKKFHAKKNHVNKFKSLYQYGYERITPENIGECIEMSRQWFSKKDVEHDERLQWEIDAMKLCFDHYRELDMLGGLLRVDGKVIAFTVGSAHFKGSKTCIIHFEKAFTEYSGAYAAINNMFVENECAQFRYINREEDMGIEGLRKSKLSLNPCFLLEKYEVKLKAM